MLDRAQRLGGERQGGSGGGGGAGHSPANFAHFRLSQVGEISGEEGAYDAPGSSEPTTHDSPNVSMPVDFLT